MNNPNDRVIEIRAKFDGVCSCGCNLRFQAGTVIWFDKVTRKCMVREHLYTKPVK